MLNNISLQGRLVRDPELRNTQTGIPVASFTIACDRGGKDLPVDFIDCVAWKGTAEMVSRFFHKGNMIFLKGRLQSRKWEDKEGNKRTSWEVVADSVYFGDSKSSAPVQEPVLTEVTGDDEGLPF